MLGHQPGSTMHSHKHWVSGILLASVCILNCTFAMAQTAKPTAQQVLNYPSYPTERTLWHEVLSPANSDISATINNRPFSFDDSKASRQELDALEPKLQQALECAKNMLNSPKDIVDAYCNLGCFYFLSGKYDHSHENFHEALGEAIRAVGTAPLVAPLLDYDTVALRAMASRERDSKSRHSLYERAEKQAMESLQIRTKNAGYHHADVAHSLINLAYLYHDRALDDDAISPSARRKYTERAHALEQRVDELMNPSSNEAEVAMSSAILHRERSAQLASSASDASWEHRQESADLLAQATELKNKLVFVSTNPRTGRPSNSSTLSASPVAQVPKMLALAESIIQKCHDKQTQITLIKKTIDKPAPLGLATIIGNWTVPSDITTKAEIATAATTKETVEGVETRSGRGEQSSQVADQEIFLCPASRYSQLYSVISNFASSRGLAMADFGQTWPANHQQAETLLLEMKRIANEIKIDSKKTDKNGDYEIGGGGGAIDSTNQKIPKGEYFLYASIVTQNQCAIWFLPSFTDRIQVTKVQQFQFDFDQSSAMVVWSSASRNMIRR